VGAVSGARVETLGSSEVDTSSFLAEGNLSDLEGASGVNVSFRYRRFGDVSWQSVPNISRSSVGLYNTSVTGLEPNTTYEFQAVTSGSNGDILRTNTTFLKTVSGGSRGFRTQVYDVETLEPESIGEHSFRLQANVSNIRGEVYEPFDVFFNVSRVGSGAETKTRAGAVSGNRTISTVVKGLDLNSSYDFFAYTDDTRGSTVRNSTDDYSVETLGLTSEDIGTYWLRFRGNVSGLESLTNEVEPPIDFEFYYRQSGETEWSQVVGESKTTNGVVTERVEGLEPNTTYEYKFNTSERDSFVRTVNTTFLKTVSGGSRGFRTQVYDVETLEPESIGEHSFRLQANISNIRGEVYEPFNVLFNVSKVGSDVTTTFLAGSTSTNRTVSTAVNGLDLNSSYDFFAYTDDTRGPTVRNSTSDYSVETLDLTDEAVGTYWLRFRGNVSGLESLTNEVEPPIDFEFYYRQEGSDSWNEVLAESKTTNGVVEERVEGLEPNTVYEYKFNTSERDSGIRTARTTFLKTVSGGSRGFRTQVYDISTLDPKRVGEHSFEFQANISNVTGEVYEPIEVYLNVSRQGSTATRTEFIGERSNNGTVTAVVKDLELNSTYSFQAFNNRTSGQVISNSTSDYGVKTLDLTNEDVGTYWLRFRGNVSGLEPLTGEVEPPIEFDFYYRQLGDNVWNETLAESRNTDAVVTERVEGLEPNTVYEYKFNTSERDSGIRTARTTFLKTVSGGSRGFRTEVYNLETLEPRRIGERSFKLGSRISGLEGEVYEPVDIFFNISRVGTDNVSTVRAGQISRNGTVTEVVTGLELNSSYEFFAFTNETRGSTVRNSTSDFGLETLSTTSEDVGTRFLRFRARMSEINQLTKDVEDPLEVFFRFRKTGSTAWNNVSAELRKDNGTVTERVQGLEPNRAYEYQVFTQERSGEILDAKTTS
jgi:hypothetical protein